MYAVPAQMGLIYVYAQITKDRCVPCPLRSSRLCRRSSTRMPRQEKFMTRHFVICILLLAPGVASAQADRFEVGLRVRDFEKAWDQTKSAEAKRRAVAPLNQAVRSFFTFNFSAVGESLDKARQVLAGIDPPSFAVRWGDSLTFRPESRFVDTSYKDLEIKVQPFYNVGDEIPKDAWIRMSIGDGKPVDVRIANMTQ